MLHRPKNPAERLAVRQSFIPKTARPILEHTNGSTLYVYETTNGKPCLISFWGTSAKPDQHHSYRTDEQRNAAILRWRESVESSVKFRADRKATAAATPNPFKVGDIVNTSWGYDQTNVDFYIVTRRSDGCVWVRAIVQDSEATGWCQERVWPKMPIEMVGPEMRCRVIGGHFSVKGHGASLTTGDCHSSSYA